MLDPVTFFTGFPLASHTVAHRCQPWRFHSGLYVDVHDRPFAVVSDLHGPTTFPAGVIINAAPAWRVIETDCAPSVSAAAKKGAP